jgi:heme oxygenase (biliverdin-producing, ferredoxin)
MSLKDLTWEHHKYAETRPFVKVLFSGKITPEAYATYLYNQHKCYDLLEAMAMMHGLMNDYPTIRRAPAILEDFNELWTSEELPTEVPTIKVYHEHLMSIKDDPKKLLAHLYVRHFGDLSGGQLIAKRVPGAGKYYQFDGDTTEIKNILRAKLDDSLADEAAVCFKFAADMFDDLEKAVNE